MKDAGRLVLVAVVAAVVASMATAAFLQARPLEAAPSPQKCGQLLDRGREMLQEAERLLPHGRTGDIEGTYETTWKNEYAEKGTIELASPTLQAIGKATIGLGQLELYRICIGK